MRALRSLLLVLCSACASAPALWTPAARPSANSCSAPGAPPDQPWRLVTGDGFTFCVPATWSSADGRRWLGGGGSITWGSRSIPLVARDVITTRPIVDGEVATEMPVDEVSYRASLPTPTSCASRRFVERIDGRAATLYDTDCGGQYSTSVHWDAVSIYLRGDATTAAGAQLQLQVYRTVRMLQPPQP